VRFAAEDVLVAFGEASIPALFARCVGEPDLTLHRHALRALGRMRPVRADVLALLSSRLNRDDWRIRHDAAVALGAIRAEGGLFGDLASLRLAERAKVETNGYVKTRIERLLRE
jgi:hypothetical protein